MILWFSFHILILLFSHIFLTLTLTFLCHSHIQLSPKIIHSIMNTHLIFTSIPSWLSLPQFSFSFPKKEVIQCGHPKLHFNFLPILARIGHIMFTLSNFTFWCYSFVTSVSLSYTTFPKITHQWGASQRLAYNFTTTPPIHIKVVSLRRSFNSLSNPINPRSNYPQSRV